MEETSGGDPMEALAPIVDEWSLVAAIMDTPRVDAGARVTVEWLPGR